MRKILLAIVLLASTVAQADQIINLQNVGASTAYGVLVQWFYAPWGPIDAGHTFSTSWNGGAAISQAPGAMQTGTAINGSSFSAVKFGVKYFLSETDYNNQTNPQWSEDGYRVQGNDTTIDLQYAPGGYQAPSTNGDWALRVQLQNPCDFAKVFQVHTDTSDEAYSVPAGGFWVFDIRHAHTKSFTVRASAGTQTVTTTAPSGASVPWDEDDEDLDLGGHYLTLKYNLGCISTNETTYDLSTIDFENHDTNGVPEAALETENTARVGIALAKTVAVQAAEEAKVQSTAQIDAINTSKTVTTTAINSVYNAITNQTTKEVQNFNGLSNAIASSAPALNSAASNMVSSLSGLSGVTSNFSAAMGAFGTNLLGATNVSDKGTHDRLDNLLSLTNRSGMTNGLSQSYAEAEAKGKNGLGSALFGLGIGSNTLAGTSVSVPSGSFVPMTMDFHLMGGGVVTANFNPYFYFPGLIDFFREFIKFSCWAAFVYFMLKLIGEAVQSFNTSETGGVPNMDVFGTNAIGTGLYLIISAAVVVGWSACIVAIVGLGLLPAISSFVTATSFASYLAPGGMVTSDNVSMIWWLTNKFLPVETIFTLAVSALSAMAGKSIIIGTCSSAMRFLPGK